MSEGLAESLRRFAGEIEAALSSARAEACAASAERYECAMEAEGLSKYQREHIHDAVTQAWRAREKSITVREAKRSGRGGRMSEGAALDRARAAAEAIIIEVLTRGSCESGDDFAAIAAMIAGPMFAAVEAEREACARVLDGMAEEEHRHAGKAFGTAGERLAMLAHQTARRGAAAIRARGAA